MVVLSVVSTDKSANPIDSATLDAGVVSIVDGEGMKCKGLDNRKSDSSPCERRSSARIKKLNSEKALRVCKREEFVNQEEDRVFRKKTRVQHRKTVDRPNVGSEIGGSEVQIEVLGSDVVKDCAVVENDEKLNMSLAEFTENGTVSEKSAYTRVTETLRIFNKHYLHLVQVSSFAKLLQ
ncbi:unnamed protein product [Ilex paraguariensis]|uniref:Uncharacterized protein n=1 Tax=Ilex paraguariensis TaxID=185542 RepID=A0ABC8TF57_9AQUA